MINEKIQKQFTGIKALVTGGTGLIGRQVVDILVHAGARVKIVSLDKLTVNDHAEHIVGDLMTCPCALVISTPVTIFSAIENATQRGALIKGGRFIEELGRVKAIAFDKARTLTRGESSGIRCLHLR